jgi:hypothetical protein
MVFNEPVLSLKKIFPSLLGLAIALQPALVQARTVAQVAPQALPTTIGNAARAALGTRGTGAPALQPGITSLGFKSTLVLPDANIPGTAALAESAATLAPARAAAPSAVTAGRLAPAPTGKTALEAGRTDRPAGTVEAAPSRAKFNRRVATLSKNVASAAETLPKLASNSARPAAARQFALLTGSLRGARANAADLVPAGKSLGRVRPGLSKPGKANAADFEPEVFRSNAEPAEPGKNAQEAAPKKGWKRFFTLKIFKDPARNKAYWRWFLGEQSIMVGFYMYMVALPFYMSSFTANMLRDAGTFDNTTKEALAEQVRQNRALARIAHWVAQAVAYLAIPFFTRGDHGPRRWMVGSAWGRAAMYAGIFGIFYGTGLVGAQTALYILLGLIGAASFFQGIAVTMSSGASARIVGDKSVTPGERMTANSVRTFVSAIIAIVSPLIAGQILGLGSLMGKDGGGGALIYGIYAASVGVAGLIFATIKMLAKKKTVSEMTGETDPMGVDAGTKGVFGTIKGIFSSMKEGIKIVWGNRFLRTLVIINLAVALFSDPLIFNALPQFMSQVLANSPAATHGILKFFANSPGGLFALLMTSSSIGSATSAILAEPLRRFMKKWFKTEESLSIPFYMMAALGVPAFWFMISNPSIWTVLGLYGLQTFLGGFVGLTITGLYQKNLGAYSSKQMNQVLAASSFINILAAIAATYAYGFLLADIPLATMLTVAAVATTVAGLLQIAAPWLMFTKAQRKGESPMGPQRVPEDRDQPKIPLDSSATPDHVTGPLDVKL